MKFPVLLTAAAFVGQAAAFWGQMDTSDWLGNEGGSYKYVYLKDYNTGSTYRAYVHGGWDACASNHCTVQFTETSKGTYTFNAQLWRTSNGCHNIDFEGALDAHHGYCCGALPCDLAA
ncbi:uncharacterized protein ACLA_044100 [Aspergillus clavatus NRRL 1]|uniref:Uncharacterized protein n=1 Tax=Aspergillus clavatus (strain ATCC 1007 / CBS 513.65 / DSM 816 / NCTC 3887 / NRRL 1 / QM 1276 / 107) TaxID=344612 RepID=A1C8Q3_ASPCL|nr:uncharacterized protein ACLA_044100 [Aspergillus clavatus NRRL 1]EAW13690.1 hypothetical protein ACLA_044100 [Aspergillus clavatus NRRL 1]